MAEKPKPEGSGEPAPKAGDGPGHLKEDDRGNITWQWANDALLQDDTFGAVQRMRALVDPALDVVEDPRASDPFHNPQGLAKGYDPYDSGALGKKRYRRKKNLRELSKWIEQRRKSRPTGDEGGSG